MAYLVSILTAIGLLVGFVALCDYEMRRGTRFFASLRMRLDRDIEQIAFILARVDVGAFLFEEMRHIVSRSGHAVAHVSLQAVRAAERLLTRLVRHLRREDAVDTVPRESMREYVKTLSDFKDRLKTTHPEVPDIH